MKKTEKENMGANRPTAANYYSVKLATAIAANKLRPLGAAKYLVVYVGALVDIVFRIPFFIGAAILWGFLVIMKYQNPMLLWVIALAWAVAAQPFAVISCRLLPHKANRKKRNERGTNRPVR